MTEIRYTLVTDGSSDAALIHPLNWLLRDLRAGGAVVPAWADLSPIPKRPGSLAEKIHWALDLYPCDLLFVHRDAERQPAADRRSEIEQALATQGVCPPAVCVIPIRMTEAWFLFDEAALRRAAGNPNGKIELDIPKLQDLEELPDPKSVLHALLKNASELKGRRLNDFKPAARLHRLAELLDDFKPLRRLKAFSALEDELEKTMKERGW